jgi:hypothetical protein
LARLLLFSFEEWLAVLWQFPQRPRLSVPLFSVGRELFNNLIYVCKKHLSQFTVMAAMVHECSNSDCGEIARYYFNLTEDQELSKVPVMVQESWYCDKHLADQLSRLLERDLLSKYVQKK